MSKQTNKRHARHTSSFQRGSGCYNCNSCGKRTRETGLGESQVELCRDCLESSELENSISDEGGYLTDEGRMLINRYTKRFNREPSAWCVKASLQYRDNS